MRAHVDHASHKQSARILPAAPDSDKRSPGILAAQVDAMHEVARDRSENVACSAKSVESMIGARPRYFGASLSRTPEVCEA